MVKVQEESPEGLGPALLLDSIGTRMHKAARGARGKGGAELKLLFLQWGPFPEGPKQTESGTSLGVRPGVRQQAVTKREAEREW